MCVCSVVLCVVRKSSLLRADDSSRGVLPTVVCLIVIVTPPVMRRPWPTGGFCATFGGGDGGGK
jgi:hypothetical protein